MYDTQTLRRLNDEAALREQFPDHVCEDYIDTDSADGWVLKATADEETDRLTRQRDALAAILTEQVNRIRFASLLVLDKLDAADLESAVRDWTA